MNKISYYIFSSSCKTVVAARAALAAANTELQRGMVSVVAGLGYGRVVRLFVRRRGDSVGLAGSGDPVSAPVAGISTAAFL